MSRDSETHTLHRYFLWANRMKKHCEEAVRDQSEPPPGGPELRLWLSAPFSYACYWFATLYVVVEGMRELCLSSPSVEALLGDEDKVQRLRRFRNGVFHYQSDYFDDRIKDFMAASYVEWATRLHEEISQLFKSWYESRGVIANVLECSDTRFRIAIAHPSADTVEITLDAVAPDSTGMGEPSDGAGAP